MNMVEKSSSHPKPEKAIPEIALDIDIISQMANAIYREGITGPIPQDSTSLLETKIPSENYFITTKQEGLNRELSQQLPSTNQAFCQLEQDRYIPDLSSINLSPPSLKSIDAMPYFLSSTQEDQQKLTELSAQPFNHPLMNAIDPFKIASGDFIPKPFQLPTEIKTASEVKKNKTHSYVEEGMKNASQSNFYFLQFQQSVRPGFTSKDEIKDHLETGKQSNKSKVDWSVYRMFNPVDIRKDFPVLQQKVNGQPLVWLDNGATTQKPQSVIDALSDFYTNYNSNIHRGAHTLAARATDAYENTREKIRQLIGAASTNEIIYVRGTTEGINLIANTFGRQRIGLGDEILISELEHHANIVPWQLLAKEKGASLRMIPVNDKGDIILESYERLFNRHTKLVAVGQVSNAIGTVLPIKKMIETAHRYGVPVVVDGAQSIQHMPVNVQDLDADFFVFSGHKIFAPTGIGAVYGKKEHLEKMPPWQGGGNMIDQVTFEETTYNGVPAIFEAGTPSIGDAIGLGAAIDYVQNLGMENIHRYETELMAYMVQSLQDIPGLTILGNPTHRAGALSFVMNDIATNTMGQLLDKEGIAVRSGHHCAQPALRHFGQKSSVRPSLAFYNTKEDIDRLRTAILKQL